MADTFAPSRSSNKQGDQNQQPRSRVGDPRDSVARQIGPMRAYARTLAVDRDAADIFVMRAIAKACEEIDTCPPQADIRTWLFGILRSAFYVAPRQSDERVANDRMPLSKPRVDDRVTPDAFRAAFDALCAAQREALFLTVAAQMSFADAADVCGCSVITLKRHAIEGRMRLAYTLFITQPPLRHSRGNDDNRALLSLVAFP